MASVTKAAEVTAMRGRAAEAVNAALVGLHPLPTCKVSMFITGRCRQTRAWGVTTHGTLFVPSGSSCRSGAHQLVNDKVHQMPSGVSYLAKALCACFPLLAPDCYSFVHSDLSCFGAPLTMIFDNYVSKIRCLITGVCLRV